LIRFEICFRIGMTATIFRFEREIYE